MTDKLIEAYELYFLEVLEQVDKKDPATLNAIAELANGYQKLRNW